jgi:hypothetical protein
MKMKEKQPTAETAQPSPLQLEYEASRAAWQELIDERARVSERLAQAGTAEDFSTDSFLLLQQRADNLPLFVRAAEIRVTRARVALLRQTLAGQKEVVRDKIAITNEVYEALGKAQAAFDAIVNERDNARAQADMSRMDLSSAERRLEQLIRESSKPFAPIVRSLPHSFRAA